MDKIEKKKKIIILSVVVTLVLAIAISFGYLGVFDINTNNIMNVNIYANKINNAVLDTNTTNFSITVDPYNMTEEASTTYIASNTSTLTVSLDANTTKTGVTCTYDINFTYDSSSDKYTSKTAGTFREFTLQVIGPEVGKNEFMSEDDFPSANMTVVSNAKISNSKKGNPSVHTWTINTKFYNLAFDQSSLINKTYSGKFNVTNVTCYQTEAINQININVTDLPYNNPNSNYSLSNLNGITSSNISWDNINRMISIKNEVNDGGSATLTKTTNTTGTLLSSVITAGVGTSGDGLITKVTDNNTEQYRYQGNNPNNYVSFNNQLWRIIGYVPVCLEVTPITEDTTINGIEFKQGEAQCTKWENRVKIIKADPIGAFVYNKSRYSSSNPIVWIGSTIQGLLNTCYLGKKDGCSKYCYVDRNNQGVLTQGVCNFSQNGINENDSYGNMIESVFYNVGMTKSYQLSSSNFYAKEIIKQVSEKSLLGLMYASDFGYAISNYNGDISNLYSVSNQMVNNWIFSQGNEFTMTQYNFTSPMSVGDSGAVSVLTTVYGELIRPVFYLQSNVKKLSGDGTMANPYVLGM